MREFKFFRYHGGLSAFAIVSLEATPTRAGMIWKADPMLESFYGAAVRAGLDDAQTWHGSPVGFEILRVVELLVDTKPDAMRCAATMAAWLELGHAETDLEFIHEAAWRVVRRPG